MKNIYTSLLAIVLCCCYTYGYNQTSNPAVDFSDGNSVKSNNSLNAVKKGNIMIEPWYGFPLLGKALYNAGGDSLANFSYAGLGPCGGAVEYMVADNVGLGIDFIYNSHALNYTDSGIDAQGNTVVYDYNFSSIRQRIHLRFNYHFSQDENVDAYLGVGVGTNQRSIKFESNDPNYAPTDSEATLIPFSMRFCVGMRYYFSPNIGIVTEAGIGGALVRAGLSIKI